MQETVERQIVWASRAAHATGCSALRDPALGLEALPAGPNLLTTSVCMKADMATRICYVCRARQLIIGNVGLSSILGQCRLPV